MSTETASVNIPSDLIRPIIEAKINMAILEALKGKDALIAEGVKAVLNVKVQANGTPSDRDYNTVGTWVEWKVRDAVSSAARSAIDEIVTQHKDLIRKAIISQLTQKNSPLLKQFAESMVTGIADASKSSWRLTVKMEEKNT